MAKLAGVGDGGGDAVLFAERPNKSLSGEKLTVGAKSGWSAEGHARQTYFDTETISLRLVRTLSGVVSKDRDRRKPAVATATTYLTGSPASLDAAMLY